MKRIEEELGLFLVREALESFLDADQASVVLLEALLKDPARDLPPVNALGEWVDDPLHGALVKRFGEAPARELLQDLRNALFSSIGVNSGNAARTLPLPRGGGRVNLLVAAGGERFARKLGGALGMQRYSVHYAPNLDLIRSRWQQADPAAVIWDVSDPILASAASCAALMATPPTPALQIIWGSEAAWGRELTKALGPSLSTPTQKRVSAISTSQGVVPLFDMLKTLAA